MPKNDEERKVHLEEKPPELLQKIKWCWLHGREHKGYVFVAVLFSLLWLLTWKDVDWVLQHLDNSPIQPRGQFRSPDSAPDRISKDPDVQINPRRQDSPKIELKERVFFEANEHPDEIMKVLESYSGEELSEKANDFYVNRWLQDPGWLGVVHSLPDKLSDDKGIWMIAVYVLRHGSETETSDRLAFLTTVKDSSELREGMRIRFTGRICEVTHLHISLDDVEFEVIKVFDSVPSGTNR